VKKAILIGADEKSFLRHSLDRLLAEGGLGALLRFLRQLPSVLKNAWQKSYYLGNGQTAGKSPGPMSM
jgi:hypothetical protein